ncbi:MAG: hypothetical protein KGS61_00795 [Verrucomicrobia bacterium]|nr:hypothetical protein [Verrucomicrobiota bacterium]
MILFKKRTDPISERARALNAEISALESQIKRLNTTLNQVRAQPRLRSTTLPHGPASSPGKPPAPEPVFEEVPQHRIQTPANGDSSPAHFNDLGMRKYDLPGAWRRLHGLFRPPPPPANPKLVSFLAAGSVQGLRPLRYEKRVARNRFIVLVVLFVLILWGIAYAFFHAR